MKVTWIKVDGEERTEEVGVNPLADEALFKRMQEFVGGYVEPVRRFNAFGHEFWGNEGVVQIVVNEDGLSMQLAPNQKAMAFLDWRGTYELVGPIVCLHGSDA